MVKEFSKGKIYALRAPNTDDVYIGSTVRSLCARLACHNSSYKGYLVGTRQYYTAFEVLKHEGCYIELVELCPCTCVEELRKREGQIQRSTDCVNKRIENRTKKEYRDEHKVEMAICLKKYREENKEELAVKSKAYYEDNKEELAVKNKVYREENQEVIAKRKKEYWDENKDEINSANRSKYAADPEKYRERQRVYNDEHKDHINEMNRQAYANNPTKRQKASEQGQDYYKKNCEAVKQRNRDYSSANKEKISARLSKSVVCECGATIQYGYKTLHLKSIGHFNALKGIAPKHDKIECECGGKYADLAGSKPRHERTKKHLKFLEAK